VIPLFAPVLAVTLGASTPAWCEAPFAADRRNRAATPSLAGLPGLLEVPAAVSAPDLSAFASFNSSRDTTVPGATQQRNAFVGFGFLPRLTLVARGSVMDSEIAFGMRDISASAQLQLRNEDGHLPSIAVGAQDIGGAVAIFKTRYLVASKTLGGRVRVSAGVGSGRRSLNGAFGGVEIAPCPWFAIVAENEAARRNLGVRLAPLGDWGSRRGVEPTLDLLWREGQGRMAGVGLRLQAHSYRAESPVARPAAQSAARRSGGLVDALVATGFENVRVGAQGDTLDVAYENRVFNREEWDALGVVMAEALRHADQARVLRVTLLRVDLPVMQLTSGIDALRQFLAGAVSSEAFARQLGFVVPPTEMNERRSNSSRLHLDLTVRPRIESLLLWEASVADARFSILPEASLHLGKGVSLTGRRAVVLHSTQRFPQEYDEPNADRILLNVARRGFFLKGSDNGAISQLSVGRFGPREVGAAIQTDIPLAGGAVSVGGMAAAFGEGIDSIRRSVALGTLRVRYPSLGARGIVTVGRFLHGDVGGSVEVERRFGLAEIGFYVQATDIAKMAGVRISVPLTFARDLRPGSVRFRLPEYYDWRKWSQIIARNDIRTDVAIPLETGQDLAMVFRGRDRINELWLRSQVERLRAAAVRWGRF
jgi:hypothetical protein